MPDDASPVRRSARASIARVLARSVAAALVAVASLCCALDASAQDAASTRRVAEETLRHGFQTALPGHDQRTEDTAPPLDTSSPTVPRRDSSEPTRHSSPPTDTSIPPAVGWTLLVIAAAVALVWIATAVHAARGGGAASSTTVAATPPSAPTTRVEERAAPAPKEHGTLDASRAATTTGDGGLDDAAHALLLAALAGLVAGGRLASDAALTSREAVDAARLDDVQRTALRSLVAVVERSRFGGRPVDAAAFAACTEASGRLAAATRSAA